MRSRWNLPVYVAYVLLCLSALGFIVLQLGLRLPGSQVYTLTADVPNAAGLLPNNDVLINGVKVGHVDSIQPVGGKAHIVIAFNEKHGPVYRDAVAQVRIKNLLGETYLSIQRGSREHGQLDSGRAITSTLTTTQIDEVLGIFDPSTRDRLKTLINEAGNATTEQGDTLNQEAPLTNQLATTLNTPAQRLGVRQQQLEDIIVELEKFYGTLANQRDQVRDLVGTWNDVMAQLAQQDTSIAGTLQQGDRFFQNLDAITSGEAPNIQALLQTGGSSLQQAQAFLTQTNTIFQTLAGYRHGIHDVFPALDTSFMDTNSSGQHLWSVYSVRCPPLTSPGPCTGGGSTGTSAQPSSGSSASTALWTLATGSQGGSP